MYGKGRRSDSSGARTTGHTLSKLYRTTRLSPTRDEINSGCLHKQAAVETVTFLQEKKGEWKAAGYYIK
jgi:hypothetical protein